MTADDRYRTSSHYSDRHQARCQRTNAQLRADAADGAECLVGAVILALVVSILAAAVLVIAL